MWPFRRRSDDIEDEIRAHLDMAARDRLERGETPAGARAGARREFGNLIAVAETTRAVDRAPAIDRAGQDIHHAWRRLRAQPGAACAAIALLALAIGMTSAMFTLVDSLVLRPAPFRDVQSFAWLQLTGTRDATDVNIPVPIIKAWRDAHVFATFGAAVQLPASFGAGDAMETVAGAGVTPGLLDDLGAVPLLGRTLTTEDTHSTSDVVLISEDLWRTRFQANPAIVGTRVEVSGTPALIAGVMPRSFAFPYPQTQVWRPLDLDRLDLATDPARQQRRLAYAYARLPGGVPRADAARLAADVAHAAMPSTAGQSVGFRSLTAGLLDDYSTATIEILGVGVGLVFLLLCVNVTNLMLARLATRRREFALCATLGAPRGRLLRQAICEQLAIGSVASVAGLAAGIGLVQLAEVSLPAAILQSTLNPLHIDLRAIVATSVFSLTAIVIAGLLPAWLGTRADASPQAHLTSRAATAERTTRRWTTTLLVGEVALAVALSVAAGVQLRSFVNLLGQNRGFDADRLTTFHVTMAKALLPDGVSRLTMAEQIRSTAAAMPGVERASVTYGVPPAFGALYFYDVSPDVPGATPVKLVMNGYNVMPDFFDTFGVGLIEGRPFQPGEATDSVIVSRSMASALWPGASAIGHTMTFGSQTLRVVGVATEILNPVGDPRDDKPELYQPLISTAADGTSPTLVSTGISVTVRCGPACPPIDALRAGIRHVSAALTVGPGKHLQDGYTAALERPRAGVVVAIAFAAIALLAVAAGLFAVLTRVALQRQREFGIRLALGATPAEMKRLIQSNGLRITAAGLAGGAALAWLIGRVLASVQFQVRVSDPLTWTIVIAVVIVTAWIATRLPARRAMRADPLALLREE